MKEKLSDLQAKDIYAGYYEGCVVRGLSMEIGAGDFVGIVGPNGSGKTSFIKSLSRALKPKKGAVMLLGEDIYGLSSREVAKSLAVVPQETPSAFDFSALEIVLMGRNPHLGRLEAAGEEDLEVARRAMESTNIWHLADRSITELSGGERQGVIIAQALAQSPRLLLLDEPIQHLDINHQLSLFKMLEEMCEGGLAVVIVVHDINLAARYCRELVMIKDGKEHSRGKPEEVIIPDNIRAVFGVDSLVTRHPVTGRPNVIFLQPGRTDPGMAGTKVHLVSGGATGGAIMRALLERGCHLTAGVLNLGDSDESIGRALEIKMVTEAPFSHISDEAHRMNRDMIDEADLVMLTDVQVGPGNLKNLEALGYALGKGKKVILYSPVPIEDRDFSGGRAIDIYRRLVDKGAVEVKDRKNLFAGISAGKKECGEFEEEQR